MAEGFGSSWRRFWRTERRSYRTYFLPGHNIRSCERNPQTLPGLIPTLLDGLEHPPAVVCDPFGFPLSHSQDTSFGLKAIWVTAIEIHSEKDTNQQDRRWGVGYTKSSSKKYHQGSSCTPEEVTSPNLAALLNTCLGCSNHDSSTTGNGLFGYATNKSHLYSLPPQLTWRYHAQLSHSRLCYRDLKISSIFYTTKAAPRARLPTLNSTDANPNLHHCDPSSAIRDMQQPIKLKDSPCPNNG